MQSGAAYRCFATKDELLDIRAQTDSYHYNGLWRDRDEKEINELLAIGVPYTIRLKTPEIGSIKIKDMIYGDRVSNTEIDDFIIVRSDGSPVYNFTNVIDDYDMRITHVIRGEDHISNTPKQIHIFIVSVGGWGIPKFAHLPMILGQDKKRLSKRHGATSVESYREQGFQPEALLNYLALLGWNPGTDEEIMDLSKIISKFDFERVQKRVQFLMKKLNWISSQYLINQDVNETLNGIRVIEPEWGKRRNKIFCLNVIKLMAVRSTSLRDIIAGSEWLLKLQKLLIVKI